VNNVSEIWKNVIQGAQEDNLMVDGESQQPSVIDQQGNTPLHYAATVEEARKLLDEGANINSKNNQGCTPMQVWTYKYFLLRLTLSAY
jgi:ankyrin repeat protein